MPIHHAGLLIFAAPLNGFGPVLSDAARLIVAIGIALLAHYVLYRLIRRIGRRSDNFITDEIFLHTSRSMRALLILIALSTVLPILSLSLWRASPVRYASEIAYIIVLTWMAIGFVDTFNSLVQHRLPEDIQDNVRARRTHSQFTSSSAGRNRAVLSHAR